MDIHAGGELHVHAVVDHLLPHLAGQGLQQVGVPGAGQGRAAGQQGAVFFQPQPRRAVGGDDGGHTLFPQAVGDAAEGAGVARHAEAAAHHAVAPAEGLQFLSGQAGDEVLQGRLARLYVCKVNFLVSNSKRLGQVVQNPLAQGI